MCLILALQMYFAVIAEGDFSSPSLQKLQVLFEFIIAKMAVSLRHSALVVFFICAWLAILIELGGKMMHSMMMRSALL